MGGFFARCLLALLVGLSLCAWSVQSQNYSESDLKAALVGQFIKNIEWPDGAVAGPFVILVPEDRAMMTALSQLDGETINNHLIRVQFATDRQALPTANLIYLSDTIVDSADSILSRLRGSGTLVVTENSPTRYNVMIDIVSAATDNAGSRRITFQINRPNIAFENLKIGPDLILYGGTELDVASLYRETEKAMIELRDENARAKQELDQKLTELAQQQAVLSNVERDFEALSERLNANQALLEERQTRLVQQQMELSQSTKRLEETNRAYLAAKEEAEAQKLAADEQRLRAEENIREQIQILESLKSQVAQQNTLLKETEATLATTSEQLDVKSSEVEQQAEVIDKQYVIIIGSIITLIVFSASTVIITKMFFKNRAVNRELATTLETLESTQEQLIESEKLASLGEMVAGVAHEINTPIGIVVTSSSTIGEDAVSFLKRLDENSIRKSEMRRFLSDLRDTDKLIQSNLERCATLIQNFKQVSADQVVAEGRYIHLKDYLRDLMQTLSVFMQRNHIEWKVTGDNPQLHLDPGLLGQVINNLLNNAINHAFVGRHHYNINVDIRQLEHSAEIAFKDNGKGMDEETRRKIFEPFFTTKRGRGGVGLGMNIVYNLVTSKLKGTISVSSEPEKGTTVIISLPIDSENDAVDPHSAQA